MEIKVNTTSRQKKSDKIQRTYLVFTDSCLLIITEHCFTAAYYMPTKDGMLFPINRKCLLKQSKPKNTQLDFQSLIHILLPFERVGNY